MLLLYKACVSLLLFCVDGLSIDLSGLSKAPAITVLL